ncbi:DUF4893 domain-containing protein [soil metagenome]
MKPPMHRYFATLFICLLAAPVLADGEINTILKPEDKARLEQFDTVRTEAIAAAKARGAAADVAELDRILTGGALPFDETFDLAGNWRCRTIKLGGDPALTIYGWFKCRVSDDGSGWKLEKLSGSQRVTGRFYTESATRLTFVGAGHYADETPRAYGSDPERDEVAYAVRPGTDRVRLEFPLPRFESKFDILELRK